MSLAKRLIITPVLTTVVSISCILAVFELKAELGVAGTCLDVGHGIPTEATRVVVIAEVVGISERTPHR